MCIGILGLLFALSNGSGASAQCTDRRMVHGHRPDSGDSDASRIPGVTS